MIRVVFFPPVLHLVLSGPGPTFFTVDPDDEVKLARGTLSYGVSELGGEVRAATHAAKCNANTLAPIAHPPHTPFHNVLTATRKDPSLKRGTLSTESPSCNHNSQTHHIQEYNQRAESPSWRERCTRTPTDACPLTHQKN